MLGVVHTHPGSLRHPSDGDYRGDSQWVGAACAAARASSASAPPTPSPARRRCVAWQPQPHRAVPGRAVLLLVRPGRRATGSYRPLPVELTLGPDLATAAAAGVGRWSRSTPTGSTGWPGSRRGCAFDVVAGTARPGPGGDRAAGRTRRRRSGSCWKGRRSATICVARRRGVRGRPAGEARRRPGRLPAAGRAGRPGLSIGRVCAVGRLVSLRKGETTMDFRPLNDTERRQLITALRGNADERPGHPHGPPRHQLRRHRRRGDRRGGHQRHQVGAVPLLSSESEVRSRSRKPSRARRASS